MGTTGRLTPEKERELEEILGIIDQDQKYYVERGNLTGHDLSKVFGNYFDIKLRRNKVEVIKIRTHYEGEMKRIAVTYQPYQQALDGYDHQIEALEKFLRDNNYEMKKHEEKKDDKKEEEKKKGKEKKKK